MVNVSYVYPNVSGIPQRGGLLDRWELAQDLGCTYIEVPADFIKNKTEIQKTGLDLGSFLDKQTIATLYKNDCNIPEKLKYILHTEPSLVRNTGYGIAHQAPLKWYDGVWLEKFACMLIAISRFFGTPPSIIEIHPGDKRNSFKDIIKSVKCLLDKCNNEFKTEPLILIENRTGQFISSGRDIYNFWKFMSKNNPELENNVGIVLDIQQLYTVTKKNFINEFGLIPVDALKGFHIHHKHRVPDLSNEIPWNSVFDRILNMENHIIINPEIHHKNKVQDAIKFCEKGLHLKSLV